VIAALLSGIAGPAWASTVRRYGVIALTILLFLLALRRFGDRTGRLAEQLKNMERTHDAQRWMLEALAIGPGRNHRSSSDACSGSSVSARRYPNSSC